MDNLLPCQFVVAPCGRTLFAHCGGEGSYIPHWIGSLRPCWCWRFRCQFSPAVTEVAARYIADGFLCNTLRRGRLNETGLLTPCKDKWGNVMHFELCRAGVQRIGRRLGSPAWGGFWKVGPVHHSAPDAAGPLWLARAVVDCWGKRGMNYTVRFH